MNVLSLPDGVSAVMKPKTRDDVGRRAFLGRVTDTLVVWTGEFGRTPMSQVNKGTVGRDHHKESMSMWLAGAGIRGGLVYGTTDDLGYATEENPCSVHDLHATMLYLLGIEHESFSVKFQGLDVRLTGVEEAEAISDILM